MNKREAKKIACELVAEAIADIDRNYVLSEIECFYGLRMFEVGTSHPDFPRIAKALDELKSEMTRRALWGDKS
jgi:hypothetical protein